MGEPHFHEEQIVERVRPARTRRVVTERRGLDGPRSGLGGFNPLALALAVGLVVFILVLVVGYLM